MDRSSDHDGPRAGRGRLVVAACAVALSAVLSGCAGTFPAGIPTGAADNPPAAPGGVATPYAAVESVSPAQPSDGEPLIGNPLTGRELFASPYTPAATAAHEAEGTARGTLLARLAAVPTGTWLLPESYPEGEVGLHVADVLMQAQQEGAIPLFVVYGVPGRDCVHGHSGGGLSPQRYLAWVTEIADNAGPGSIVILEPDALASVASCNLDHDRLGLLNKALGILADGPATYVDAGHSAWIPAETIADRLRRVGVHRVRGFSLNVSGFGAEDRERVFGNRVSALLGGSFFVVDTGRAGAGYDGAWCNPSGRAVGALPGAVEWGGAMDGRVWAKPPGESDGSCGGGPPAGQFWEERAIEMVENAGW